MTIATLVRDRALRSPGAVALREQHRGIWREISWRRYWDTARSLAQALRGLGVEPGDRVAILSGNRPEWLYADVAAAALRAVTVGLDPAAPAGDIGPLLASSAARVLVAEDQEQVDKALAVLGECPALRWIVYLDPRGVRGRYADAALLFWDDLLAGAPAGEPAPAGGPGDPATLVYTPAPDGPPRAATLTVADVDALLARLAGAVRPAGPPPGPRDLMLSCRPLPQVAERAATVWLGAATGAVAHFGESLATVRADLREVQPTLLFADAHLWAGLHADVVARLAGAARSRRAVARLWLRAADGTGAAAAVDGGRPALGGGLRFALGRLRFALGWLCWYRALRERIGLRYVRYATGGADPVAPEVRRFFAGLGVVVRAEPGPPEGTDRPRGDGPAVPAGPPPPMDRSCA